MKQHLQQFGLNPKEEITRAATELRRMWQEEPRWRGIRREYAAEDVVRLRGSIPIEYTVARYGSERLWHLLATEKYVGALGCVTGMQAVQAVKAGLKAVYLSGWQTAADNNLASQTYPDQSLYPVNSVPDVVKRINNALLRADQIEWAEKKHTHWWLAPIMADAEAGFGGPLNAFELMKSMIEAGAAAVHWEDQLASEKKCGHMGGKVLVPTSTHIRTLTAARLAADVCGVPTMIVARTDSLGAALLTSDIDARDTPFITGERTLEGYFRVKSGMESSIARGLSYAPYADMLWVETAHPDLDEARHFADAVHAKYPGKPLMYNCSPSFNWRKNLSDESIRRFHEDLAAMGYKFQFITLAGFHSLNAGMFELAKNYAREGMPAYVRLQENEFALEAEGYSAVKHQREVGTGYFDEVSQVISQGLSSTLALKGSTEEEQFLGNGAPKVKPQSKAGSSGPST
ncbi:MAG: isocitrate lyase [Thermoplasmatota archaeon]